MKWFKHLTTAMDDLFIRDLEGAFGDTGYVFWFKTLELIGSQGDAGVLEISETNWRQVIHSRRTDHLRRLYEFATKRGRLKVTEIDKGLFRVECPKFVEYSDNYTKYSKHLQRDFKESSKQEVEVEEEVEQKKKKIKIARTKNRAPSTPEEAQAYFVEIGSTKDEADKFHNYYSANGWVQGRQGKPIVDWKAAARHWKTNQVRYANTQRIGRTGHESNLGRAVGHAGKYGT